MLPGECAGHSSAQCSKEATGPLPILGSFLPCALPGQGDEVPAPYRGLWREEGLGEAVEVSQVELDAGVGDPKFMDVGGAVLGTDVTLSRERGHSDGVLELIQRHVV